MENSWSAPSSLKSAAAHVAIAREQFEGVVGFNLATGFVGRMAVDAHLTGENGALGLLAAFAKPAFEELLIQSHRGGQCARGRRAGAMPE
jgi:hypothetical protein